MENTEAARARGDKSPSAFRTISEVSAELDVPQHVLRFWESKFSQLRPMKRAGGRRYYRPEDIDLLTCIRDLLYSEGYTIRGVQKLLREKGVKGLIASTAAEGEQKTATPAPQPVLQQPANQQSAPQGAAPLFASAQPRDGELPFDPPPGARPAPDAVGPAARREIAAVLDDLKALRARL